MVLWYICLAGVGSALWVGLIAGLMLWINERKCGRADGMQSDRQ
jgi:hypothetical protein